MHIKFTFFEKKELSCNISFSNKIRIEYIKKEKIEEMCGKNRHFCLDVTVFNHCGLNKTTLR